MSTEVCTFSEKETFDLAKQMALCAHPQMVICLDGDLGAGKTVFVKGYALGLGINENVTSPTFTLIHEYSGGRIPLYHFDFYRLLDPYEIYFLGFDEYFYGNGICLIEWAKNAADFLPLDSIWVHIFRDSGKNPDKRKIVIS